MPGVGADTPGGAGFPGYTILPVDVIQASGISRAGTGVLVAPDEVLTSADLVWVAGSGVASSVQIEGAQPDHYEYFQVGAPSRVNDQADFALLHVTTKLTAPAQSQLMSLAANFAGFDQSFNVTNLGGYPLSGPNGVNYLFVSSQPDKTTSTIQMDGPVPDPGFTGGPLLYNLKPGTTEAFAIFGIETAGGFPAEISQPILTLLNSWIAADHSGNSQPTGAIAEPIPALLHAITPDTGATGVNPAEAVLVDSFSYGNNNPDVVAAGMDPAQHFAAYGWHENRAPDPLFDVAYYLAHNPDVAASGMDPLLHYATYGWKEGRDPSAAFSTKTYLAANHDVQLAGIDPLQHYLLYGVNEARTGTPVG